MEDRGSRVRFDLRCPVKMVTSERITMEGETKYLSADGAFICCPDFVSPRESIALAAECPMAIFFTS